MFGGSGTHHVTAAPQVIALKVKYEIWMGMEAKQFPEQSTRRWEFPAFVPLDAKGSALAFLDTERETIATLCDWSLDDPKGIF